jgi:hypothetical protein
MVLMCWMCDGEPFARHHLGGNVFNDVSTLIDVLFPKFELEGGGYYI